MDVLSPQYYFYNIFLQTFCRFSLQTLAKVQGGENRKWRWIFAFDRCGIAILLNGAEKEVPTEQS